MSKKRVVFHVGTPKTGTTYLQNQLAGNREKLSGLNIAYHQIDKSLCACHWWFAISFFENIEDYGSVRIDLQNGQSKEALIERGNKSVQAVREELKYNDVILSAEQFFFLSPDVLQRIRDFFEKLNVEITVVVYVREFLSVALSEVNQKVKMGMASLSSFENKLPTFNVLKNIEKFRSVFGSEAVVVKNYSSLKAEGRDIVEDFLGIVNKSISLTRLDSDSGNQSLSHFALKIIDKINALENEYPPHSFERDSIIDALSVFKGDSYYPNKDVVDRFYHEISTEEMYLKDEFGISFEHEKPTETGSSKVSVTTDCERVDEIASMVQKLVKNLSER